MNFEVINKNTFQLKINNSYMNLDINNQSNKIKEILLLIKKRYALDIIGFYEVNIYSIDDLLSILIFKKINKEDMLYNTIDLKIINHNKPLEIIIDDFEIDKKNKYKVCEHYIIKDINLLY